MRALIRVGDRKTLTLDNDHPEPIPKDHYLLRVHATALTREELTWPEFLRMAIPVPGYDVAGTIIFVPSVPHPEGGPYKFKPGDQVYGMTSLSGNGNAREISEGVEKELALKPRNVTWEETASIPLSALTAWQALFVHGKLTPPGGEEENLNPGKRLLVTAASGGVGIWGVQLARQAGIEIVGTCGKSNVEWVKRLGADTVLDYTQTNILDWVNEDREARAFDIVLDCVGRSTLSDAWKCVRPGGKMISVAEPADPKKPAEGVAEGVTSVWFIVVENAEQLEKITELIESGKCRGLVDSTFELDQWPEAFEKLEKGHAKGKIVLKL